MGGILADYWYAAHPKMGHLSAIPGRWWYDLAHMVTYGIFMLCLKVS